MKAPFGTFSVPMESFRAPFSAITITITVVDRGRGFVPASVHGGYGLLGSIRHRVIEARGQCDIISTPGEGTTVEISWKP